MAKNTPIDKPILVPVDILIFELVFEGSVEDVAGAGDIVGVGDTVFWGDVVAAAVEDGNEDVDAAAAGAVLPVAAAASTA